MSSAKALPILRNQAPGFFRYALGNLVVTALYDGYVTLDPMSLSGITDEERKSDLTKQLLPTSGALDTSVNAFFVHDGDRLILIDAGSAHFAGPSMGRLLDNIAAAGYKPDDVDTILLTHMHPDHIGGITNDKGEALFPNAIVWAHKDDSDFWLNNDLAATLAEDQRPFFTIAQDAAAPYIASERFKTFAPGDDLIPGLVSIVEAPGHTPGHTAFMVNSAGEKMLFWGDISHLPSIQLPHPGATIELDVYPDMAIASRERVLAASAEEGYAIGAAHLPFPGIGRVRKDDTTGYAWVAVEYSALPAV
ncbi:MBL fold metallo-hydrolase [Klebsiella grimontii]|uniref:MBL fold metallo-hydrolase n=1 Tax=Klebsiella grimontii TaxID=2058152 RepID=UPI0012B7056F|nr:MBL fold metallo-hydrolase [Klebsiella grimontii]